jgi:hypothetical protein
LARGEVAFAPTVLLAQSRREHYFRGMTPTEDTPPDTTPPGSDLPQAARTDRVLSPAALRALTEAEARRRQDEALASVAAEEGGPAGLEPTRFGDWERKGLAVDF